MDCPICSTKGVTFSTLAVRILQRMDSRIQIKGFPQAIEKALRTDGCSDFKIGNFRPDAYLIDLEQREITFYEIEDSHCLTIEKLEDLIQLFWALDEEEFLLRMVVFDRYLQNRRELDLWLYDRLLHKEHSQAALRHPHKYEYNDTTADPQ